MALAMEQALLGWAVDGEISAAIVRGAGERGLCAGGDIVAIHRDAAVLSVGGKSDADAAASPSAAFWRDEYRLNTLISRYRKPYVAIMDGIVMGGGVGISAHGNIRVVTDHTKLGMPEVGIGFIPDVGGTHLLSKVPDELGTYVALTAGTIRAADAIAIGLADHYIPADGVAAALQWWQPGEAFPAPTPASLRWPNSAAGSARRSPVIRWPTSSPGAGRSVPRRPPRPPASSRRRAHWPRR